MESFVAKIKSYPIDTLYNFILSQSNAQDIDTVISELGRNDNTRQIILSSRIEWRYLALQAGIRLPLKRYNVNKIRSHILKRTGEYKKLNSFLKNKK